MFPRWRSAAPLLRSPSCRYRSRNRAREARRLHHGGEPLNRAGEARDHAQLTPRPTGRSRRCQHRSLHSHVRGHHLQSFALLDAPCAHRVDWLLWAARQIPIAPVHQLSTIALGSRDLSVARPSTSNRSHHPKCRRRTSQFHRCYPH